MAARFVIAIAVFASICFEIESSSSSRGVKYSYTGDTGPAKWGSLDPKFSQCVHGKRQSPIDIHNSVVRKMDWKPLMTDYRISNVTLADNVVNVGLHFGENSGVLISDVKQYKLKQLHWHTPSEHKIDGVLYDAELHLVHLADDGSYAVMAILYRLGKPDPLVTEMQNKLSVLAKESRSKGYQIEIPLKGLNLKELQEKTHKYYKYDGSFTTPPCTEVVTWYILGKVKSISQKQIAALRGPLDPGSKHNSRPVQPLDGRQIHLYEKVIPSN